MSVGLTPRRELAPGYRIAPIVHGCWQLASDHGTPRIEERELHRRWNEAISAGFTTFDCADIYTGVERRLGRFLRTLASGSGIQVHTKYVPDRSALADLDRFAVERAIDRSLRRLGVETLDLVQFHWWDYDVPGWLEVAGWLDELRRAGKIRHLGVTNFDLPHLRGIVEAGVRLVSAQVQYSLLDRRPAGSFAGWCREREIGLLAYGALAGGLLAAAPSGEGGAGDNRSLVKYRLMVEELGGSSPFERLLGALGEVARERGVSIPSAALRWVLERPGVAAAIVGTGRRNRLRDLQAVFADGWEQVDWSPVEAVLAELPGPRGDVYGLERDPNGPHLGILRMNLGEGGERDD